MNTRELDRFGAGLALLALFSPVFGLSHSAKTNFVAVHGAGAGVFVVVGVVALVGLLLARAGLVLLAGAASLAAALAQLVQFGRDTNWLAGNGSTFALLLALGLGLVVTARARAVSTDAPSGSHA